MLLFDLHRLIDRSDVVYDFDLMMQRKREESSRRRKRKGGEIINDDDDVIAELIGLMKQAADVRFASIYVRESKNMQFNRPIIINFQSTACRTHLSH